MQKPSCEACRWHQEKTGKKKDCKDCLPELHPENEDAANVYMQVRNQAIYVGADGIPVDLNYSAVEFVMKLFGIENQRECFRKVLMVWHHIAELDRLKRKSKRS